MKKNICLLIGLNLFLLGFSGCVITSRLEYTSRFYKVTTATPLPPKPDDFVAPIIRNDSTRRSYKVIGIMEFESGASDKYILDAVQYNARIHGADAVILTRWEKEKNNYVSWYPGSFSYSQGYACDNGMFLTGIYAPAQYFTDTYVTTKIKAEMIIFLDHDTFGFLGFILEDVRNADYLEVGQIIPGSPADKSGIVKGDHIKKIGGYSCSKGLDDYYRNSPLTPVGQNFDVEVERDGKNSIFTLTADKINPPTASQYIIKDTK
ncbi:MAG: PDZ domain-containing protein [Candidatus Aureabacteria bacterium]|nr:PDZ domain-containing protein [Candidatus Auribacterota bacterium]